ncbi:kinase-like protein [Schizopora paradoxa]|uniref:Kinase-like protein n=1 Tax=Schizopora paradoxa TaxID=27342 RepID=A0A0H2RK85_9AGAM|nr:kinase-like protein [Schizopora paradoxa]
MNEEEEQQVNGAVNPFTGSPLSEEPPAIAPVHHETHPIISQPYADIDPGSPSPSPSPQGSPHVFHVSARHPSSIFDFPTPTPYAPPPGHPPTAQLTPFATGSTSALFRCLVKKPEVVQLEINGELHSNAADVTTQFLAELRLYTTVTTHRGLPAFLGCLEGVGMVLECVDGRTLLDAVRAEGGAAPLTQAQKIDYHNQLLDGLAHIHSFGLSHGDLSLLNVFVTHTSETIKILDFGRSVAADSIYDPPSAEPVDPFSFLHLHNNRSKRQSISQQQYTKRRKVEQIHPGTRPFCAPEILRAECQDAILADAYSFGVILACLDQNALIDCDPEIQMKDIIPDFFFQGCALFRDRIIAYLQRFDRRRRLSRDDMIAVKRWWDAE